MNTFSTVSPIDQSVYCEHEYASEKHISDVITQAKVAQTHWQQSTLATRTELCQQVVAYFQSHRHDIANEISWQMGRPIKQAANEIDGLTERAEHMIALAPKALSRIHLPEKTGFNRYINREPLGTVLVLAPWNYPYLTAVNSIIPAIMAGNTVILKHSSQTPLCATRFNNAFNSADCPNGVFNYLHTDHAHTQQLIQQPDIDFVAFTGSVEGGIRVQQAASERFIPVALELGGKDPAYVRHDANLKHAIPQLVDGAFYNSGQSCCGIERIYVHHNLFNDFVDGFVDLVKQYRLGNPLQDGMTLGPVVTTQAANTIHQQIKDAISQGATALINGNDMGEYSKGAYVSPQVLINVNHDMRLMRDETFGPAVGIMAVQNDEEALHLMNDSEFGLTASIWTQSEPEAVALGQRIHTGTVFMNRCDYLDPGLAWTGVKNSGRGYSLSELGYHQLTRAKSFHLKTTVTA